MSEFFIYILIFFMSLSMSQLSFSYSKIVRTFYAFGKSVPEVTAICFDEDGNQIFPYFSKGLLEEKTRIYFAENLRDYDYTYELDYSSSIAKDRVRDFKLHFSSQVGPFFHFSKTAEFYVNRGVNYGS